MYEFEIITNLPVEYTAMTKAMSELLYACGSKTLCGACFAGKLHVNSAWAKYDSATKTYNSCGCCSNCVNLMSDGCVQKPMGCAGYMCELLRLALPTRIEHAIRRIRSFSEPRRQNTYSPGSACYPPTLRSVAAFAYTKAQRERMATAAARLRKLTNWVRKTGWKPNWPLVERVAKADPGVLV
jgi:hypothetical protein